jgi:hypothetical protein
MASKYDTSSLKVFDNEVLEIMVENQLKTRLDMNQFITLNYGLTTQDGNTMKVRTYIGSGDVQDVGMGEGNTQDIGASFKETSYEVTTTQGRAVYYDEQLAQDSKAVDVALQRMTTSLTNDVTDKVIVELGKTTYVVKGFDYSFGAIVDAVASMPNEVDEGLFLLVDKTGYAKLQKQLKDTLQYTEGYARTGYVGTVAGIPVYMSAAVPEDTAFLATRDAVTCFMKKGNNIETERDANVRKNTVYARNVKVIALTDETKAVKLTVSAD